jgi:hypothetical protein
MKAKLMPNRPVCTTPPFALNYSLMAAGKVSCRSTVAEPGDFLAGKWLITLAL